MWTSRENNRGRGLAVKLTLFILVGAGSVFLSAFLYDYHYSRRLLLSDLEEKGRHVTLSTVYRIDAVLRGIEKVPTFLAYSLERRSQGREEIINQLEEMLVSMPEIWGAGAAFEPYGYEKTLLYFAPYFSRKENGVKFTLVGDDSYRYFGWDWYQIPKELDRPSWIEPYFGPAGNVLMTTYSVPFYRREGNTRRFAGVVVADVSLDWLTTMVSQVARYESGYAFLISQNGIFVTHPDEKLIMKESIFSVAEAAGDEHLRRIGRCMITGGQGFARLSGLSGGSPQWIYYAPLPSNGWSLGVVISETELFAGLVRLNRTVFLIGGIGLLLLAAVVILVSGTITRPLRALAAKTREMAEGNLDVDMGAVRSRDEVGELTRSFDHMRGALKEYMADLARTTAAKERMESELAIARDIQMSFLTRTFPSPGEESRFEVWASLEPAREVGGDLYDFSTIDDRRLYLTVGDVSGKGVPAALFMAVTQTLMKGMAQHVPEPSQILGRVNEDLCRENDASMFVTLFCAFLDLETGVLSFSNGGHNPPLLLRQGASATLLPVPDGLMVGIMEDADFRTETVTLAPGDLVLLYTDGVVEAINRDGAFYTTGRFLSVMEGLRSGSCRAIVEGVLQSVKDFAGEESQADDITVLALRYRVGEDGRG